MVVPKYKEDYGTPKGRHPWRSEGRKIFLRCSGRQAWANHDEMRGRSLKLSPERKAMFDRSLKRRRV